MCPCEGTRICGYHAARIREGLAEIAAMPESLRYTALEMLGQQYGREKVSLIANLDEPMKVNR